MTSTPDSPTDATPGQAESRSAPRRRRAGHALPGEELAALVVNSAAAQFTKNMGALQVTLSQIDRLNAIMPPVWEAQQYRLDAALTGFDQLAAAASLSMTERLNEAMRPAWEAQQYRFDAILKNAGFDQLAAAASQSLAAAALPALSQIGTAAEPALSRAASEIIDKLVAPGSVYWLSLETTNAIQQLVAGLPTAPLHQLAEVGQLHLDLAAPLAMAAPPRLSTRPVSLWHDYILDLPAEPEDGELETARLSGQASLGMLAAGVTLLPGANRRVEEVEGKIVQPWQAARLGAIEDLYNRLRGLDPTVPDMLNGAWEQLDRQGPAAVSMAAHCIVEAIDRTLRKAAPTEEVREWFATSGLRKDAWDQEKAANPPHNLRIRYLLQSKSQAKMATGMWESLAAINSEFRGKTQAAKHADQGTVTSVRALLLTAEHLLMMIFLSTGM